MNHIGLFEGIGGFSLAARWMGWNTIAWCENNPFCQKILKYHFPEAKEHGDIKTTDFTIYKGQCGIVTGGFPCQPFSVAGKRKGNQDDRFLWKEMLRAIGEIQPGWVVGENVPGLLNWKGGMVLNEIKSDLESAGFEVFPPCILPSCGKNAPHRRDRLWIIAHNNGEFWGERRQVESGEQPRHRESVLQTPSDGIITNPECIGQQGQGRTKGFFNSKTDGNWKASWSDPNGKWPTVSPIRGRDDGLSSKLVKQCLEGLGNAVVPQVVFEIFKAIEQVEV